jgi:hypothetical protein
VIRTLLALTVLAVSTACVANPAAPGGPAAIEAAKKAVPPASPPPSPAGLNDLTGVWVIAAPGQTLPVGRVESCEKQQVLVLKQQDETITGYRTWFGYIGEIPLDGDSELVEGTLSGGQHVWMAGTVAAFDGPTHDVVYEFSFDLASLHLKGKRNGQPFEAAQLMCSQLGRPEFQPQL